MSVTHRHLGLAGVFFVSLAAAFPRPAGASLLDQVGFDPVPGTELPLDRPVRDADGHAHRLGDLLVDGRPAALIFGYYHCRRLCETAIDALARAALTAQADAPILFVGIDARESPADAGAKRDAYARSYGHAIARWQFLTAGEPSIAALTRAVGLRVARDANGDLVHAAGVVLVTPQGRIAGFLPGVAIEPDALRNGLALAARDEPLSPARRLLILCSQYDVAAGAGRWVIATLQLTTLAMALALGAALFARRRGRLAR